MTARGMRIARSRGFSLVAVDPGVTTGMAWLMVSRRELVTYPWRECVARATAAQRLQSASVKGETEQATIDLVMSQAKGWEMAASVLSSGRLQMHTDWVIEGFTLRERTKDDALLSPVRVTEGIERDLHNDGYEGTISKYDPSQSKGVITDARLKHWGLWHRGSPHVRDAMRQLFMRLRELSAELRNGE